jgi:hypothetical protein
VFTVWTLFTADVAAKPVLRLAGLCWSMEISCAAGSSPLLEDGRTLRADMLVDFTLAPSAKNV